jgi:hypothetical protein
VDSLNFKNLISETLISPPKHYACSNSLVLRPNYLLYFCKLELKENDLNRLYNLKVSYLLFENASLMQGLVAFLKTIKAGAYISSKYISKDSFVNSPFLLIALVDPHILDEIHDTFSFHRIGVLIRKKTLAINDFQIEIPLT